MKKKNNRLIILLIVLSAIGIIAFQVNWLFNTYRETKEKVRKNVQVILDDAVEGRKRQMADSARKLMKMIIRSNADFKYDIFHDDRDKKALYVGFTGLQAHAAHLQKVWGADTLLLKKDPYRILEMEINRLPFDDLERLSSVLIGTQQGYEDNSLESKVQYQLMLVRDDIYKNTPAISKILKQKLHTLHIPAVFKLHYYHKMKHIYRVTQPVKPKPSADKSEILAVELPARRSGEPLTAQLENLTGFISQKNAADNYSVYIAKPLLYDNGGDFFSEPLEEYPTLLLVSQTPLMFILSNMKANIAASLLTLLCVGLCMALMLITIRKQNKLAAIKNDLISNISHELKTPVATALAAVQGMQHFDVLKDPDKTTRYLNTAADEIKRLGLLVNKIINISIFEGGSLKLNLSKFNLKQLLTDIVNTQQIREDKDVKITLDYQAAEELFADRMHLQNAVVNLVDNAINYSGGEVRINIDVTENAGNVLIRVADNGQGITPEYQKRIFEKFFRVPGMSNTKGYGLGLNYVKQIAEKHGGSIVLEKSDGGGSTFLITLPA